MKVKSSLLALGFIGIFVLSGCSMNHKNVTWIKGETTKADIVKQLGEPDEIRCTGEKCELQYIHYDTFWGTLNSYNLNICENKDKTDCIADYSSEPTWLVIDTVNDKVTNIENRKNFKRF